MGAQILIVEDDDAIASGLVRVLDSQGYDVQRLARGSAAVQTAGADTELVVLDLGLPDLDGIEVCRRLRGARPDMAILILSARDQELDVVAGLDAGADDYLVKPFAFDELLARIRALLRRAQAGEQDVLRFADLTLDPATREVRRADRAIDLTTKEYELLEFFLRHPRQVLSRQLTFERVWGSDFLGDSNLIDVHIMRLREKLEAGGEPRLIHTIRGAGYSLRQE